MTTLKKYYENNNGDWISIVKTKIFKDDMYLLEWKNKNESSYDENFYTYYNHALVDYKEILEQKIQRDIWLNIIK